MPSKSLIFLLILEALLLIGFGYVLGQTTSSAGNGRFAMKVEDVKHDTNETVVVARPYLAPVLFFRTEDGGAPVTGQVLYCTQQSKVQKFGDHEDDFVIAECEGNVRLKLQGVTLNTY